MQNQFPSNEDFARVARLNNFTTCSKDCTARFSNLKATLRKIKRNARFCISPTTSDRLCPWLLPTFFGEQLKIQTNEDDSKKPLESKINKIIQENYLDEVVPKLSDSGRGGLHGLLVRQKDKDTSSRRFPTITTSPISREEA